MNEVKDEIMNELNWKERMIVRIFPKTLFKVWNYARIKTVNKLLI